VIFKEKGIDLYKKRGKAPEKRGKRRICKKKEKGSNKNKIFHSKFSLLIVKNH